jgi:transglutaminase-like putative cysteine protease
LGRRAPTTHPLLLAPLALAALCACALLWLGRSDADTILHEFFVIPAEDRAPLAAGDGPALSIGDAPDALTDPPRGPGLPPPLTVENRGEEAQLGPQGPPTTPEGQPVPQHNGPFDAEDLARPDRKTTLDSELTYFSVFNPSVVPWKRASARDEIHADYSMGVRDRRTYKLTVQDRPERRDHERFWGSILLKTSPGQKIPLPSVSPRAEILRYQTEPRAFLTFYRDMADNFYVSADHEGTLRVNFLMEAHQSYFGGELDPNTRVDDLEKRLRPRLPPAVQATAEEVLTQIGVDRAAPFRDQLSTLVAWFRAFEARDFPSDQVSQDIYRDLALSQLGVCRHRAFAFVVTAHAAGIQARYVHNEAHAFVEVLVPRRGWLRIDLGGAAVDFDVRNTAEKVLHSPPEEDSLPKPENFADSYSHRLGNGEPSADIDADGQPDELIDGAPHNPDKARPTPGDQPQGLDPDGEGPPSGDEADTDAPPDLQFPEPLADAFQAEPPPQNSPTFTRRATRLHVISVARGQDARLKSAFRGDPLTVRGALSSDQGLPLEGQPVRAYLVPKGEHQPDRFLLLGEGRTDPRGEVSLEVKIPETVALGPWSLYLYFSGSPAFDQSHSP